MTIKRKNSYVGPPPKPNWFCMKWSHKLHYFGIMKIAFMLILNQEKQDISWKSGKISESAYPKGKVANLLKMRFLVTLNPNEGRRKRMT